jgi:hypothetical protein
MPDLGKPRASRAAFIVIGDVIDVSAHGKAPHQPRIEGPQQFGRRFLLSSLKVS